MQKSKCHLLRKAKQMFISKSKTETEALMIAPELRTLTALYIVTCTLCAFMVFWILVLPSSWLMERSDLHDRMIIAIFDQQNSNNVVPKEIVTKYAGHTAVHLTHTLPSCLWAGAIPFQLHSTWRDAHRKAHRLLGYVFVSASLIMMVGVIILFKRGLFFEDSIKQDSPSMAAPSSNASSALRNKLTLVPVCIWFLWTLLMAVWSIRKCKVERHRRWIIRHVGSGIWVAVQRVLLSTVYQALVQIPVTAEVQRKVFGEAAQLAIITTVLTAEYAVYLLDSINATNQTAKEK